MAPSGLYEPVTFEPNRTQRAGRWILGVALLVAACGIMSFARKAATHADAVLLIMIGLCSAAFGVLVIATRRAYTTIDAAGIYTSGRWGRRACPWADVTDVELKIDATDGEPLVYHIKIHRRGGRSFTLGAPSDAETRGRHDNPEFEGQLAVIKSYWRNGAGPQNQG